MDEWTVSDIAGWTDIDPTQDLLIGAAWQGDGVIQWLDAGEGVTLFQLDSDPFVDMIRLVDNGEALDLVDTVGDRVIDRFFIDVDQDGTYEYAAARVSDDVWAIVSYNPATGAYEGVGPDEALMVRTADLPDEIRALVETVMPHVSEVDVIAEGPAPYPAEQDPTQGPPDPLTAQDETADPSVLSPMPAPWVWTGPAVTGGTDFNADSMYGNPLDESQYWVWQGPDNLCVPAAVFQIVSEYAPGQFETMTDVVEFAYQEGLIEFNADGTTDGMTLANAELLLEATTGIDAHLLPGSLEDIAQFLESGHDVIVFVDSMEYWAGTDTDGIYHAAVITGIDFEQGVVILSDTGVLSGALLEVPLEVFAEAWEDLSNSMLVMSEPAPGFDALGDSASSPGEVRTDGGDDTTGASEAENFVRRTFGEVEDRHPVDRVLHNAVRKPWVLLPLFLAATRIKPRSG